MRVPTSLLLILSALLVLPGGGVADVAAQETGVEAYYRGLAAHFDLPAEEVQVLSGWQIQAEEVPVALFVARRGGVSVDALLALREGGRSWSELANRYDVGTSTFHVPLPSGTASGPLAAAYERFGSTSPEQWDGLTLSDDELVQLVNLQVLSEYLDLAPVAVLRARAEAGSYVAAYLRLVRSSD